MNENYQLFLLIIFILAKTAKLLIKKMALYLVIVKKNGRRKRSIEYRQMDR